jgi:Protein of unknown function (DUF2934)
MAKTSINPAVKTASSKPKSAKKSAPAVKTRAAPALEISLRVDDDLIRERAYGIWIAEGRPDGREHAHWQRAKHELLAAQ